MIKQTFKKYSFFPKFAPCVIVLLLLGSTVSVHAQESQPTSASITEMLQPGEYHDVLKPKMVTAEEWNSTPDPMPDDKRHEPKYVTLHHAGVKWLEGSDPMKKIKNLQTWGKNEKGWPDVPYHFLIAPDGRIFEGRSLEYEPETNTNFDTSGHVNIQLWGSFGVQRPSQAQVEAAVEVAAWACAEYQIPLELVRGHRDVAQTGCPGPDFYRYIESGEMREWVETVLMGIQPNIKLGEPLPDGPFTSILETTKETEASSKPKPTSQ
jgi:hypothetical protein